MRSAQLFQLENITNFFAHQISRKAKNIGFAKIGAGSKYHFIKSYLDKSIGEYILEDVSCEPPKKRGVLGDNLTEAGRNSMYKFCTATF